MLRIGKSVAGKYIIKYIVDIKIVGNVTVITI